MGTTAQHSKIAELQTQGYSWDKSLSAQYCAVVMKKGKDLWVFGLAGEIDHNPETIVFSTR